VAIPNLALVDILRETADRIEAGADYQWSHFGKCNCGHLAQTATRLSAVQIHRNAFCRFAEWSEIPDDFCPQTGVLIDRVVDTLFELGINASDLRHLEDLTDGEVLRNLPGGSAIWNEICARMRLRTCGLGRISSRPNYQLKQPMQSHSIRVLSLLP